MGFECLEDEYYISPIIVIHTRPFGYIVYKEEDSLLQEQIHKLEERNTYNDFKNEIILLDSDYMTRKRDSFGYIKRKDRRK